MPGGGGLLAWSASCLVIGAMSLVLAASLNPTPTGADAAPVLEIAMDRDGRWLAMAAALFAGSIALLLGLPTLLTPFTERSRRLGALSVGVFAMGVLGSAGFAMLLVFLRALAQENVLRPGRLPGVMDDVALVVALFAWVAAFYLGTLLMAIALLRARQTALWIPVVLIVVVSCLPVVPMTGRVGQVLQAMLLAIALTGIATSSIWPASATDRDVADPSA